MTFKIGDKVKFDVVGGTISGVIFDLKPWSAGCAAVKTVRGDVFVRFEFLERCNESADVADVVDEVIYDECYFEILDTPIERSVDDETSSSYTECSNDGNLAASWLE